MSRAVRPCLLSAVQLSWLVLSAGCYLAAPINLSSVWATWVLSESVLPVKNPWPPGLHRPWFDLTVVLLFKPRWPVLPWLLFLLFFFLHFRGIDHFEFCLSFLAINVMSYLVRFLENLCYVITEEITSFKKEM